jgi:hypothetical protein
MSGIRPMAEPGQTALKRLVHRTGDVAAVERQQRDEVEQRDEQVH